MKAEANVLAAVFGPAPFRIEASGRLSESISRLFDASAPSASSPVPWISYHIVDEVPVGDEAMIVAGSGQAGTNALHFCVPGFEVRLEVVPHGEPHYRVHCSPSPTRRRKAASGLPTAIQRLLTSRYSDTVELLALDFVYHVFLWSMQLALRKGGASLIHASSMHSEVLNETLLMAGWGGVGKTSLASFGYLEHSGDWQFLADDFSIIDAQGTVWFNPMGIHYYPYNTEGFPRLWDEVSKTMSPLSRLHWHTRRVAYGNSSVVRRINPQVLWSTARESQLSIACVLERWTGGSAQVEKIDVASFAGKAAHVLMHELRDITVPLILENALRPTSLDEILPSLPAYVRNVEKVLEEALANARLLHVLVPEHWSPRELGTFLFDALELPSS